MDRQSKCFDNSMISMYRACPRFYYLRYVLGLVPDRPQSPALTFGLAWHAAMDAVYKTRGDEEAARFAFEEEWLKQGMTLDMSPEDEENLAPRTPMIAFEMLSNYIESRRKMLDECVVLSVEQPIAIPFPGLDDTYYVGRLDKVIQWNGIHVMDHKTTTAYSVKGQFRPDYISSWNWSTQMKGYQVAAQPYYPTMQDVWIDAALVHKKVHNAFRLIPVSHFRPLLEEWLWDTRRWIQEIEREEQDLADNNYVVPKGGFRMNEDEAYGKYGPSPFLDLCSTGIIPRLGDPPPPGYKIEKWEPFDIHGLQDMINEKGEKK